MISKTFHIKDSQFDVSSVGDLCVIRTKKGVFIHEHGCKGEPQKEDLPTMFFTAMAGTYEGQAFPQYEDWLGYICEHDCKRNRAEHARFLEQAKCWGEMSDVTADEILDYLNENYKI